MKKRFRILVLSFLTIILISLAGCSGSSAAEIDNQDGDGKSKMSNNDVICGGTTNNTDYNAPKEISSDNLVSFSVGFYHENKYDRSNGRYYTFVVEPDENGELYFSDTYVSEGFSVEQSVLQDIQAIIKKYDLVKANGVHKVTAGLPPEYEECYLKAEYDSGEYLSFSENSDPSAEWSEELLEYFANLMAEHGDDRYIIPSITGVIERFHLEVKDGDLFYSYDNISVPKENVHKSLEDVATTGYDESEADTKIYRTIYDQAKEEMIDKIYADPTPEYYEGIFDIINEMEIRDFETLDSLSDIIDGSNEPDFYYEFYIEFEDGDIMSGASVDPETIEQFNPMLTRLMEYMDTYLEEHQVQLKD